MKQSAVKTLGVAALGAAFAAAGAGAANAAPAAVAPDAGQALGTVSHALPTENITKTLPGADQALNGAQPTLRTGLDAARPVARSVLEHGPAQPVAGLLGGLPVRGLSTHGLPVDGLPLS